MKLSSACMSNTPKLSLSSEALYDSTRFTHYVLTRFAQNRVLQIDFRHDKSTTGETIRVNSIESSQIDNIFNPPCIAHWKSRSVKCDPPRENSE